MKLQNEFLSINQRQMANAELFKFPDSFCFPFPRFLIDASSSFLSSAIKQIRLHLQVAENRSENQNRYQSDMDSQCYLCVFVGMQFVAVYRERNEERFRVVYRINFISLSILEFFVHSVFLEPVTIISIHLPFLVLVLFSMELAENPKSVSIFLVFSELIFGFELFHCIF